MRASELRHKVAYIQALTPPAWAKNHPLLAIGALAGSLGLAGSAAHGAWEGAEYGLRKGFGAAGKKISQNRGYKKLLKENDDLKDSEETRRAFNTMHRFAPDVAKDPMVAGTFVKRVTRFGEEVDPNWVKTLVDVQSRHKPGYQASGMGGVFAQNVSRGLQMGIEGGARAAEQDRSYQQRERTHAQKEREIDGKAQGAQAQLALNWLRENPIERKAGKKVPTRPQQGASRIVSKELGRDVLKKTAQSQLDYMRTLRLQASRR